MEEDIKLVHIRMDAEFVKKLDYLTVDYDLYRTDLIEMLLEEAYERVKKDEWDLKEIAKRFKADVEKAKRKQQKSDS